MTVGRAARRGLAAWPGRGCPSSPVAAPRRPGRAGAQAQHGGQRAAGDEGRAGRRPAPAGAAPRLREARCRRSEPVRAVECLFMCSCSCAVLRPGELPCRCTLRRRRVATLRGRWDPGHKPWRAPIRGPRQAALGWAGTTDRRGLP